jgi:hypothetical protein
VLWTIFVILLVLWLVGSVGVGVGCTAHPVNQWAARHLIGGQCPSSNHKPLTLTLENN